MSDLIELLSKSNGDYIHNLSTLKSTKINDNDNKFSTKFMQNQVNYKNSFQNFSQNNSEGLENKNKTFFDLVGKKKHNSSKSKQNKLSGDGSNGQNIQNLNNSKNNHKNVTNEISTFEKKFNNNDRKNKEIQRKIEIIKNGSLSDLMNNKNTELYGIIDEIKNKQLNKNTISKQKSNLFNQNERKLFEKIDAMNKEVEKNEIRLLGKKRIEQTKSNSLPVRKQSAPGDIWCSRCKGYHDPDMHKRFMKNNIPVINNEKNKSNHIKISKVEDLIESIEKKKSNILKNGKNFEKNQQKQTFRKVKSGDEDYGASSKRVYDEQNFSLDDDIQIKKKNFNGGDKNSKFSNGIVKTNVSRKENQFNNRINPRNDKKIAEKIRDSINGNGKKKNKYENEQYLEEKKKNHESDVENYNSEKIKYNENFEDIDYELENNFDSNVNNSNNNINHHINETVTNKISYSPTEGFTKISKNPKNNSKKIQSQSIERLKSNPNQNEKKSINKTSNIRKIDYSPSGNLFSDKSKESKLHLLNDKSITKKEGESYDDDIKIKKISNNSSESNRDNPLKKTSIENKIKNAIKVNINETNYGKIEKKNEKSLVIDDIKNDINRNSVWKAPSNGSEIKNKIKNVIKSNFKNDHDLTKQINCSTAKKQNDKVTMKNSYIDQRKIKDNNLSNNKTQDNILNKSSNLNSLENKIKSNINQQNRINLNQLNKLQNSNTQTNQQIKTTNYSIQNPKNQIISSENNRIENKNVPITSKTFDKYNNFGKKIQPLPEALEKIYHPQKFTNVNNSNKLKSSYSNTMTNKIHRNQSENYNKKFDDLFRTKEDEQFICDDDDYDDPNYKKQLYNINKRLSRGLSSYSPAQHYSDYSIEEANFEEIEKEEMISALYGEKEDKEEEEREKKLREMKRIKKKRFYQDDEESEDYEEDD